MMQGITALPGAQQQNPGQAAPAQVMPPQQGGIAAPITGTLEKLPPQQLLSMYNNPQDMTPKWAVATAYAKAVEQARLMQMAQGQSAMAQGQAQAQQPPVVQQVMSQPIPETQYAAHGGIMHGYAGGGAVAFQSGGGIADPFSMTPEEVKKLAQRMLREQQLRETFSRLPPTSPTAPTATPSANAAPTYGMRALGTLRAAMGLPAAGIATGGGWLSYKAAQQLANMDRETREQFIGMPDDISFAAAILNATPPKQEEEKVAPTPTKPEVDPAVAEIMERNYKPRRYPSSTTFPTQSAGPVRPSPGIANLPGAGGARPSTVPATTPSAESELAAAMKKLEAGEQKAYEEASTLSPELIEARRQQELARQAGSKSRRDIEQRRLSDIQSQEEELKKGQGLGALDNPLLMMAIASRAGGKNIGDVLRGGVAGGYEEASRQQKDFRDRMDKLRAERLGVDQITIANMDYDAATQELKVAQLTGDRDKMNAAKTKLLEAQRHLLEVQQRDVGSQRQTQIAREQMANAIKVAQIGAAARESATSLAEQRLAIQAMRADPSYAGIVKELTEAKKLAGVSNSPTFQARLRAAEAAAKQLAQQYGVTSMTMGMGAGAEVPAASSAAAPPGFGKAVEVKG